MAINKSVKIGGSYYKGYSLTVNATPGDYVLDMTLATACVINGISIIVDTYGIGDYVTLEHRAANGDLVTTLADTVYNVGANAAWQLDFSALEKMEPGDKLRLIYTNVAGSALKVYTNVERIR